MMTFPIYGKNVPNHQPDHQPPVFHDIPICVMLKPHISCSKSIIFLKQPGSHTAELVIFEDTCRSEIRRILRRIMGKSG
jgi:hypothetical protein